MQTSFGDSQVDVFRELMRHLAVDSFGRCLNNRTLEEDGGSATLREVIRGYRFTLAFENSIAADYVTEKLFNPLAAGSVPVYLGAPNVADFAPGERCYLDVRDFAGRPMITWPIDTALRSGLFDRVINTATGNPQTAARKTFSNSPIAMKQMPRQNSRCQPGE